MDTIRRLFFYHRSVRFSCTWVRMVSSMMRDGKDDTVHQIKFRQTGKHSGSSMTYSSPLRANQASETVLCLHSLGALELPSRGGISAGPVSALYQLSSSWHVVITDRTEYSSDGTSRTSQCRPPYSPRFMRICLMPSDVPGRLSSFAQHEAHEMTCVQSLGVIHGGQCIESDVMWHRQI